MLPASDFGQELHRIEASAQILDVAANEVRGARIALAAVLATSVFAQARDTVTPHEPSWMQGSTINNRANANQAAPGAGITKDLRPDTKQKATGRPVGGGYGGSG